MTDYMLLPNQSLFAVHNMHDVTGKEALATDYYYYYSQAITGGKQKVKHASLSAVRSRSILGAASIVTYYTRWNDRLSRPMTTDHFWAYPTPYSYFQADIM